MSTFLDTSALLALLDREDARHPAVAQVWERLVASEEPLVTTNYIVLEALAVCQRRLGVKAAHELLRDFLPAVDMVWVDEEIHARGISVRLGAMQRDLSLTDCVSFLVMSRDGIKCALALDRHYRQRGIECLP